MDIKQLQGKFLDTCGQIKQTVNHYIITPLDKRVREAMQEVKKVYSLAIPYFAPLKDKISEKQVDIRVSQAIMKCMAAVLSASTKGVGVIKRKLDALHEKVERAQFQSFCDLQISRSDAKIAKIDKQLNKAKKVVTSKFQETEMTVQAFHHESLNQTATESLQRYLEDPSAENLYQIGDSIRRQIDQKAKENRTLSASNKFYTGLRSKGLDIAKIAELNALLREKRTWVQERDAWISKKAAGPENRWFLTV